MSNDLPTTDNGQHIDGDAIALRAVTRAGDGSAVTPPLFQRATESVRLEIERLGELRELLADAEVDLLTQEKLWRDHNATLKRSRDRHLKRLIRYRRIRKRFREVEKTGQADSSSKQIELDRTHRQLADAVAMLESARDAQKMDAGEHQVELEGLREQLALALRRGEESNAQLSQLQREVERLRRACGELESENTSLANEIADLRVTAVSKQAALPQAAESMTWEQRKAAILEQLRQEDLSGELPKHESQTLRQMIHRTSEEVARRDREIAELRELLDQQSATIKTTSANDDVAIGAAGIAMIFDSDELICEERSRLQNVQAEWTAKLRKAEVELSLERAKLARERRDIELKQGELEDQLRQIAQDHPAQRQEDDKTPRRRWLTQLGLSDGG